MNIFDVKSNDAGIFVAVGGAGTLLVSIDYGATWYRPGNIPDTGTADFLGVAYGLAQDLTTQVWTVVGEGGVILTSNDLNNWTLRDSGVGVNLNSVAWADIIIAVGNNGEMVASGDYGVSWEQKSSGTLEHLFEITVDEGAYVIVGANDTIIYGELAVLAAEIVAEEFLPVTDTVIPDWKFNHYSDNQIDIADTAGGRTSGQKVDFTLSGSPDLGDQYEITLNGTTYDTTIVIQKDDPVSVNVVYGFVVGTTSLANVETVGDGLYDHFTETEDGALPGLDIRYKFEGLNPDNVIMTLDLVTDYDGDGGHLPIQIEVWNFDTQLWEIIDDTTIVNDVGWTTATPFFTVLNHVAEAGQLDPYGVASLEGDLHVRIHHFEKGKVEHNFLVDHISVHETPSTLYEAAYDLALQINANPQFSAYVDYQDQTVHVTSVNPPTDFTYSSSVLNDIGVTDAAINSSFIQSSASQKITAEVLGTVEAGDQFTITLNGVDFSLTVTGETTNDEIATALAALIDADPAFVATATAGTITIESQDAAVPFTYSYSTVNGGATDDQDINILLVRDALAGMNMQYSVWADELFSMVDPGADVKHHQNVTVEDYNSFLSPAVLAYILGAELIETIALSDSLTRVMAKLIDVIEQLSADDTLSVVEVEQIREVCRILDSPEGGGSLYQPELSEGMRFETLATIAWALIITEELDTAVSAGFDFEIIVNVIERLVSTGIAESRNRAISAVAEAMLLNSLSQAGKGGNILETVDMLDSIELLRQANVEIITDMLLNSSTEMVATMNVDLDEEMSISDDLSASAILQLGIFEGIIFNLSFGVGGSQYTGYVMNARNFRVSEYENYPFNSLCKLGDGYFGMNQNGLYQLETGDDDDGAFIDAAVRTGLSDLGTDVLKTIEHIYLGFRGNGDILLKTITKEEVVRWYKLTARGEGAHVRRVKCGRGVKSTYWAFEMENVDGSDFEFDMMDIIPVVMTRRMRG